MVALRSPLEYTATAFQDGGKIADDIRITPWGRFLRKFWIDELPMLWNFCRGEVKIVGVRPLSEHYFSLYPASLRQLRLRHKPGLIPPFYADLPKTLEGIVSSEQAYLEAYERSPYVTDLRYGSKAAWNILVRGARSG